MPRIEKSLNLVVPVYGEDDSVAYVHAAPIDRETFEKYFMVLGRTFTALYSEGLGTLAGPRLAMLTLKQIAVNSQAWEGPYGVEAGLVNEMRRLANVAVPRKGGGWDMVPFQDAISKELFDPDDVSEVDNALAFFTVAWRMHRREERRDILDGALKMWGAHLTSYGFMELTASLTTSTATDSTGEKVTPSSIAH